jgi:hypothetical protein
LDYIVKNPPKSKIKEPATETPVIEEPLTQEVLNNVYDKIITNDVNVDDLDNLNGTDVLKILVRDVRISINEQRQTNELLSKILISNEEAISLTKNKFF